LAQQAEEVFLIRTINRLNDLADVDEVREVLIDETISSRKTDVIALHRKWVWYSPARLSCR
jgi:hypothetical protein